MSTLFTSHLHPKLSPLFTLKFSTKIHNNKAMAKDHTLHLSEKPFSLLQANELFVHKILSRNSSFGRSARLPACRLPGQIPFNWETQPGLPKHQSSDNLPPPDLPPPSASAVDLSKTPHKVPKQTPVKIWFWKKPRRKLRHVVNKNGAFGSSSSRRHVDRESEFCRKSNDESSSSSLSCISYSLSSNSSSASSSNPYARRRSKLGSLAKGFIRWAF